MPGRDGTGPYGQGSMTGRGRRCRDQGGGFLQGPGGECICPNCHHREAHTLGVPCYNKKCPKCGAPMTRA